MSRRSARLLPALAAGLLLASFPHALHATPINPGGNDGGGVGGNAGSAPGPGYSWVSSVDNVNTGTGNKVTTVPTVSWVARGGLVVDLTLYHNSERTSAASSRGAKWSLIYDTEVKADASGNVAIGWGDGRVYTFGKSGTAYTPPPGIHDTLIANGSPIGSYDVIQKDQTKWHFAPFGTSGGFYLTSISDENGNTITVNRAANGGPLSITDPTNRTVTFGYNSTYFTSITDPLGRVFQFGFDGNGNMSKVTYPILNGASYAVNLGYDGNHNVTSYQDRRGNTATFLYNSDSSLAWEKDEVGNPTTFTYGYDGINHVTSQYATTITDPNNHLTVHHYDAGGRLNVVTDALNDSENLTYNTDNMVTQKQDKRGFYWNYTYDGNGNVLTAKDPYTNTTTYTYNSHNRPLTIKTQLGRRVAGVYDASDNLTQVQEQNANGNVLATTTYTVSSATYGLVTAKTDANNHKTLYGYDTNGDLSSVTTPLGYQTTGHQTKYTYDALGFLTSRTDAMNRTTTYTPDAWERRVTTTYPDTTTATFGYDPNGNLTAFTNYTAPWTRTYDADDRETAEYCGAAQSIRYTYDATGQKGLRGSFTDSSGRTVSYAYTARNELSTVADPAGNTTYQYDPNGNQTAAYLPDGRFQTKYYRSDNTLDTVYNAVTGTAQIIEAYNNYYNADDQLVQTNEGYSANPANNTIYTAYGYDGQGHLSFAQRVNDSAYLRLYTCDGVGNRTLQGGDNLSGPMTYDADDELTGFSWNNGSTGNATFGYNMDGERTSETTGITSTFAGYGTQYGYDFDGQLTSITKSGSTTTYRYDPLGRQVSRTVNGALTGFGFDGGQVILEEQNSVITATYTWGNGLIRRNGEFPLTDGRGNVRHMTDSNGTYTESVVSDPFGVTASVSGGSANPYVYNSASGYRSDGDGPTYAAPLQKVGARYYDPEFGCFLTRDTDLTEKPYVYCDGEPVSLTDPDGHKPKPPTKKKPPLSSPPATSPVVAGVNAVAGGITQVLGAVHGVKLAGTMSFTYESVNANGTYTKITGTVTLSAEK